MANEAYLEDGTAKVANTDFNWTICHATTPLTSGAGRVAAQIDWGAHPRADEYSWSLEVQFQATPTQYATLDLYVAGAPDADSTQIDGDVGASDAALGDVDMRYNLKYIGSIVSENAAAAEKCVASGRFRFTERYMSLVAYNGTGATASATAADFVFTIRPIYYQGQ